VTIDSEVTGVPSIEMHDYLITGVQSASTATVDEEVVDLKLARDRELDGHRNLPAAQRLRRVADDAPTRSHPVAFEPFGVIVEMTDVDDCCRERSNTDHEPDSADAT
jgi:hypothetical protein